MYALGVPYFVSGRGLLVLCGIFGRVWHFFGRVAGFPWVCDLNRDGDGERKKG